MAIILGKKKPVQQPAEQPAAQEPTQGAQLSGVAHPTGSAKSMMASAAAKQQAAPQAAKTGGMSFLKRGKAAATILAQEDAKAELSSNKNLSFRFWIPKGKSCDITFLDGALADGMLDIPYFHQHTVFMSGTYNNWFTCTADDEPCPICEGGGQPEYVGALSVIDHSEYVSKKDGKTYKNQIKLFIAKRNTLKVLLKKALKQGGLAGCTFNVSRTGGDKSPNVGDDFEFDQKRTLAELNQLYGTKEKPIKPLVMEDELKSIHLSAADLRKLGFGSASSPIGAEPAPAEDYEDVL